VQANEFLDYLVYNRGSRDDFDNMAKVTGDQGWSYVASARHPRLRPDFATDGTP
jgi:choline dehydrogenase-like flavoprotein